MKSRKVFIIFLFICFISILFIYVNRNFIDDSNKYSAAVTDSTELNINNPNKEQQTVRILVIEINPVIESITSTKLYGTKNNGHPTVSQLFGHDRDISIKEMVEDIEFTSHGYFKLDLSYDYINEFPTYREPVVMSDGTVLTEAIKYGNNKTGYRFKESEYLKYAYDAKSGTYSWWNLYINGIFGGDPGVNRASENYIYNYDYLLYKTNLVERRNNNEFDMVWLVGIDPMFSNETKMVGRNAYYINGDPIEKNCYNFMISGASFSRRDGQFHAFGHSVDNGIMRKVFGQRFYGYSDNRNEIPINSLSEYNQLNLWEKYNLTEFNSGGEYSGVGNIHFPFNAEYGYDYSNKRYTKSNWEDWLNYPNFKGEWKTYNNDAWMKNEINQSILNDSSEEKDPDRLYTRFWFYLLPHLKGYTSDGYLNNWWKYIFSLDVVDSIKINNSSSLSVGKCSEVNANYTLNYNSTKKETLTKIYKGDNVHVADTSVLEFKNGTLYGKKAGTSKVTIYYDGKKIDYNITVSNNSSTCSFAPTFKLSNAVVDTNSRVIKNIQPNTTLYNLYNTTINNDYLQIFDENNNLLYSDLTTDRETVLSTGDYVKFYDDNRNSIKYNIAVNGDVDGNGEVSYLDVVKVYNHKRKEDKPSLTGKSLLTGEYRIAGDMDNDGDIDYLDTVKVYNLVRKLNGKK